MEKAYLAVVEGAPSWQEWICDHRVGPVQGQPGRMRIDARHGKDSRTRFKVLARKEGMALIEARPETGRTHQIRVHLASAGCPVARDFLYGRAGTQREKSIGLRAVRLSYQDPFTRRAVVIRAPTEEFLREYGFDLPPDFDRL